MSAVLTVSDLQVRLGGRAVLDGVNLQLSEGSFTALLGPNGAGKTTLLRTILGVQKPAAGTVGWGRAKPVIGYVPQLRTFAWDYPVTVSDVVAGGLRLRPWQLTQKRHYQAVYRALAQVKMSGLAARHIGGLSGGQRQRVLLARALVNQPQLLILDEPFTGLDQPTTAELTALFRSLTGQGAAVFMSSHDLAGAIENCDELVLLNRRVLAQDAPAALGDPSLWARTFAVSTDSTLVRTVSAFLPTTTAQPAGALCSNFAPPLAPTDTALGREEISA